MKFTSLIVLLFGTCLCIAQNSLDIDLIPESLRERAHRVVRNAELDIHIQNVKSQIVHVRKVITVLDPDQKEIQVYGYYDKSSTIKDLFLRVYDAEGREVYKSSKKDIDDNSAVEGSTTHSDFRIKSISYRPFTHPYTYEYSYKYQSNNTAFINSWLPIDGYNVSVEHSRFRLEINEDLDYSLVESNFKEIVVSKESDEHSIVIEVSDLEAIAYESFSPSYDQIFPMVKTALDKFHLEGQYGDNTSWASLSQWYDQELIGPQSDLGPEVLSTITELIDGLENDQAKAAAIYKYVQQKSRYISIQLGIGGWKPYASSEVHKLGYGDCKGLTNYLKNLLALADIESKYCVVSAGNEQIDIDSQIPSLQGNHVFLCIPQDADSIWLECTSKNAPFGEIGYFTDDRLVFMVDDKDGKIIRSKKYAHGDNSYTQIARINLSINQNSTALIDRFNRGTYLSREFMAHYDPLIQKERITRGMHKLSNMDIVSLDLPLGFDHNTYLESYTIESPDLLRVMGKDIIVSIFPFSQEILIPKLSASRINPIEITRNKRIVNKSILELPASYIAVSEIDKKEIKSAFGVYTIEVEKIASGVLEITSTLSLNEGRYPSDSYDDFRAFFKQVVKADNQKIILEKS